MGRSFWIVLLALTVALGWGQGFQFQDVSYMAQWPAPGGALDQGGITMAIESGGSFVQLYMTNGTASSTGTFTNGSFNWGWATNNSGQSKVAGTVVCPGFDGNGNLISLTRPVTLTRQLRLAYPNQTNNDITTSGAGRVEIRTADSEYVYSSDSNATFSVSANLWSNNVSGAGIVATNNSVMKYPNVVAKPLVPDFDVITTTNWVFPLSAFQHYGIAWMQVIANDQHSNTNSSSTNKFFVDFGNAAEPQPTYKAYVQMSAASFVDGDRIDINYVVKPSIGDTNSILDTRTIGWTATNSPYPHKFSYAANLRNGVSQATAYADAAVGNDTTGRCVVTNVTDWTHPPAPFATIPAALTALKGTNNMTTGGANNTAAGGLLALGQSGWSWSMTENDVFPTYVTVMSEPTNTAWASITNGPCSSRRNTLLRFRHVTFPVVASVACPLFGYKAYDVQSNYLNTPNTAMFDQGILYFRYNTISNFAQGLTAAENSTDPAHLIIGNTAYGKCDPWDAYCTVGNLYKYNGSVGGTFMSTKNANNGMWPQQEYSIVFNNGLYDLNCGNTPVTLINTTENLTNGMVFAQNVIEGINGQAGYPNLFSVHADGSTGFMTNMMVINNTTVGSWINGPSYNDQGTGTYWVREGLDWGNLRSEFNAKTDVHPTQNAARIGNWDDEWAVGGNGNINLCVSNVQSSAGGFQRYFAGLNSYAPPTDNQDEPHTLYSNSTNNFAGFVSDGSFYGAANVNGAGNGDYHVKASGFSATVAFTSVLLPFDMEGSNRTSSTFNIGVFSTLK